MRQKFTQPGNPHKLTIDQHLFPRASLARFAGAEGKVAMKWCGKTGEERHHPTNWRFCAQRLWDQRSEAGWMHAIEDEFQALAQEIVDGLLVLSPQQNIAATRFFTLWLSRALIQQNPVPDHAINGVPGERLTQDQQERLEKLGRAYISPDQTIAGRFLCGLQISQKMDALNPQFEAKRWGIVKANEGEFICPDTFEHAILPVTPSVYMFLGQENSTISKLEVAKINGLAERSAKKYRIARDFSACPT